MSSFSNLIDISSFFIGVLINLLLVALICYYFKRKIDNLELAQSEQAKMLYSLIHKQEQQELQQSQTLSNEQEQLSNMSFLKNLDLSHLENNEVIQALPESNHASQMLPLTNESARQDNNNEQSDIESGSDSDSDDESDTGSVHDDDDDENHSKTSDHVEDENTSNQEDTVNGVEDIEEVVPIDEVKTIQIEESEELNYDKMTIKELKQLLESRGNTVTKRNIKKQELIDILVSMESGKSSESDGEISVVKVESSSDVEEENEITDDETEGEQVMNEEQPQESTTTDVVEEPSILADDGAIEIRLDDGEIQ